MSATDYAEDGVGWGADEPPAELVRRAASAEAFAALQWAAEQPRVAAGWVERAFAALLGSLDRLEDGAVRETADHRAARQHVWLIYRRGCASRKRAAADETQDALCAPRVEPLCGATSSAAAQRS